MKQRNPGGLAEKQEEMSRTFTLAVKITGAGAYPECLYRSGV